MVLEPDRATFRRLIWLHIALSVALISAMVVLFFSPGYLALDAEVQEVIGQAYRTASEPEWRVYLTGSVLVAVVIWALASIVGLFWYKRWARFGFWASNALSLIGLFLLEGTRPFLATALEDGLSLLASASFGAVVLLSYLRGAGAVWFNDFSEN